MLSSVKENCYNCSVSRSPRAQIVSRCGFQEYSETYNSANTFEIQKGKIGCEKNTKAARELLI